VALTLLVTPPPRNITTRGATKAICAAHLAICALAANVIESRSLDAERGLSVCREMGWWVGGWSGGMSIRAL